MVCRESFAPLPPNFCAVYQAWRAKQLTVKQAAEAVGMPVITFYHRVKKLEQKE
jgi:transcriptional regulator of acetoin/glycerol metabolism